MRLPRLRSKNKALFFAVNACANAGASSLQFFLHWSSIVQSLIVQVELHSSPRLTTSCSFASRPDQCNATCMIFAGSLNFALIANLYARTLHLHRAPEQFVSCLAINQWITNIFRYASILFGLLLIIIIISIQTTLLLLVSFRTPQWTIRSDPLLARNFSNVKPPSAVAD